jgi:hypothetical protein
MYVLELFQLSVFQCTFVLLLVCGTQIMYVILPIKCTESLSFLAIFSLVSVGLTFRLFSLTSLTISTCQVLGL